MPARLKELMRHGAIDTTMKYYVGQNAQATADVLWGAYKAATGDGMGHTASGDASTEGRESTAVSDVGDTP